MIKSSFAITCAISSIAIPCIDFFPIRFFSRAKTNVYLYIERLKIRQLEESFQYSTILYVSCKNNIFGWWLSNANLLNLFYFYHEPFWDKCILQSNHFVIFTFKKLTKKKLHLNFKLECVFRIHGNNHLRLSNQNQLDLSLAIRSL